METAGFHGRSLRRAPAAVRRNAALAGLLVLVAIHIPLVVLYACLQARTWLEMAAAGIFPAPGYYGFFPLQGLRLLILVLFSMDVAMWVAMLSLLPLDTSEEASFFDNVRRKMRRNWLFIHAPLVSLAGFLAVCRLYWITSISSGVGAAWFVPGLSSAAFPNPALSWVRVERWLLLALALYLFTRLALLTGLPRPKTWVRHILQISAAVALLTLMDAFVLVPLVDGGLSRVMARGRDAENRACPGTYDLSGPSRIEVLFDAMVRTPADAPSLRELPQAALPLSVTALPPLPFIESSGLPVVFEGRGGNGLPAGMEMRVDATGTPFTLPLPPQCSNTRVLKVDRTLPWNLLQPLLGGLGSGSLRLAFRPTPLGVPRNAPDREIHLILTDEKNLPPGLAPRPLPLPFAERVSEATPDWDLDRLIRIPVKRTNPFRRQNPLDPLWQPALPLVMPPPISPAGDLALSVPAGLSWDDLLRALASSSHAKRVFLVGNSQY